MLAPIRAVKYSQDSLSEELHSKAWEILSEGKKAREDTAPPGQQSWEGFLPQAEETTGKVLTTEGLPRKESLSLATAIGTQCSYSRKPGCPTIS